MKKDITKNIIRLIVLCVLSVVLIMFFKNRLLFTSMDGIENGLHLSIEMVINAVMAVVLVVLVSNILLVIMKFLRNMKGRTGTIATVMSSLIKYGAVLIAFCWVLSIFASVGIVALILGFGAESLVADLVTGVFILFENQYNVGDIVEIDGFRGKVKEIGIRTLSLEDSGGNVKIISNSELKNIVNRSNYRSVAVADVGVSYETDLEELDEKLVKILATIKEKHPDVFVGRVECAGVESLADFSVVIRFIADVNEENIFTGKRILNKELKIAFDKAGIEMPYPQIVVHK